PALDRRALAGPAPGVRGPHPPQPDVPVGPRLGLRGAGHRELERPGSPGGVTRGAGGVGMTPVARAVGVTPFARGRRRDARRSDGALRRLGPAAALIGPRRLSGVWRP